MYCAKCGKDVPAGAQFCASCGAEVAPQTPATRDYAHLPEYWQNVFRKFDQNPTKMQTYWNWPAFFFGFIWYLLKGMPAKGLLYIVVMATGVGWLFLIIYAGLYGAWDYYLKESQGKQLW